MSIVSLTSFITTGASHLRRCCTPSLINKTSGIAWMRTNTYRGLGSATKAEAQHHSNQAASRRRCYAHPSLQVRTYSTANTSGDSPTPSGSGVQRRQGAQRSTSSTSSRPAVQEWSLPDWCFSPAPPRPSAQLPHPPTSTPTTDSASVPQVASPLLPASPPQLPPGLRNLRHRRIALQLRRPLLLSPHRLSLPASQCPWSA